MLHMIHQILNRAAEQGYLFPERLHRLLQNSDFLVARTEGTRPRYLTLIDIILELLNDSRQAFPYFLPVDIKEAISSLTNKVNELSESLKLAQHKCVSLEAEVAENSTSIESYSAQLSSCNDKVSSLEAQIAQKDELIQMLRDELDVYKPQAEKLDGRERKVSFADSRDATESCRVQRRRGADSN